MRGTFKLAQGLNQDGAADAVVEIGGEQAVADGAEAAAEGGCIADLHACVLFAAGADVEKKLLRCGSLAGERRPLHAERALNAVGEVDAAADERIGQHAADGGEAAESLCVDVGYHDADLVHVGGEHDPLAIGRGGGGALARYQVAEIVRLYRVDNAVQQAADGRADTLFVAGGPVDRAQLFDQRSHFSLPAASNGRAKEPARACLINSKVFSTSAGSISAAGVWM